MKKTVIIIALCIIALAGIVCAVILIPHNAAKHTDKPVITPTTAPTDTSDTAHSDTAASSDATEQDTENTFTSAQIPLCDGESLLTDASYAQCMSDVDNDGTDDRITCATLADEYETMLLCVQFGNGTTPDVRYTLCNGYLHPELFCGKADGRTVLYVRGTSQGSDNEQMIHPFICDTDGSISSIVNPDAEYTEQTGVYMLPCFSEKKIGTSADKKHIKVETEYAPALYLTIPKKVRTDKAYDPDYGLRILSQDCTMTINSKKNRIKCTFICAWADPEEMDSEIACPVKLHVTLVYDGGVFSVTSWTYEVKKGITYSDEGNPTPTPVIATPTPTPAPTSKPTPTATPSPYRKTVHINGKMGETVRKEADLDADGKNEVIEIVSEDEFGMLSSYIYSSEGDILYSQRGHGIKYMLADLTLDGRLTVFAVVDDDSCDMIAAMFIVSGECRFIKFDFYGAEEERMAGLLIGAVNGKVTFALRQQLLGSHDWNHTTYYDEKTNCMRLTDSDYRYKSDRTFILAKSTYAYDKSGNKVNLKKGTLLTAVRSDMKSYLYMKDEKGRLLRLDIEPYEWYYKINGVSQDDLFQNINYTD